MNCGDIRVIEGRENLCFALEASHAGRKLETYLNNQIGANLGQIHSAGSSKPTLIN